MSQEVINEGTSRNGVMRAVCGTSCCSVVLSPDSESFDSSALELRELDG
jgi:hypothetical protein